MCIIEFLSKNVEAIIAISALGLAIWQGLLQRRHNHLSVKPHLVFDKNVTDITPQITILLSNTGTGPAIIKHFKVYIDGEILNSSASIWHDTVAKKLFTPQPVWSGGKHYSKDDAIPVGAKDEIFLVKTTTQEIDPNFNSKENLKILSRIQVEITYESVYGKLYIKKLDLT